MDFKPTEQQNEGIRKIIQWFRQGDNQVFYLAGYAGTGKTTITQYAIDALGLSIASDLDVMFGAYTGKAALVMRKNGLITSTTIHRMIYQPYEDEHGHIKFRLNKDSMLRSTKLVVLDECSMIDDNMANDLKSFGVKILVLGDPGQIRPIKGEGAFTRQTPDHFLTEVHRQAADSPIIKLATWAREKKTIPLGDYGDGVRVVDINSTTLDFNHLLNAEQIITGKNDTRRMLNKEIKDAHGFTDAYPLKQGIKLICLRNRHNLGLLNGMTFWTAGEKPYISKNGKFILQSVVDEDQTVLEDLEIGTGAFIDYSRKRTDKEVMDELRSRTIQLFDYGFAVTCHKSQGSQWEEVFIYDDGFGMWDSSIRAEWAYTAITRAAKKLTICRAY